MDVAKSTRIVSLDVTYRTVSMNLLCLVILGVLPGGAPTGHKKATDKVAPIAMVLIEPTGERDGLHGDLIAEVLTKLVEHLGNFNIHFSPSIILIDCSIAELNAIGEVFPDAISIFCKWHLSRAWIKNAKSHLGMKEGQSDTAIRLLIQMRDAKTLSSFQENYQIIVDKAKICEKWKNFLAYFEKTWLSTLDHWAKYRILAIAQNRNVSYPSSVDSTSPQESFHKIFKTNFLAPIKKSRLPRPDIFAAYVALHFMPMYLAVVSTRVATEFLTPMTKRIQTYRIEGLPSNSTGKTALDYIVQLRSALETMTLDEAVKECFGEYHPVHLGWASTCLCGSFQKNLPWRKRKSRKESRLNKACKHLIAIDEALTQLGQNQFPIPKSKEHAREEMIQMYAKKSRYPNFFPEPEDIPSQAFAVDDSDDSNDDDGDIQDDIPDNWDDVPDNFDDGDPDSRERKRVKLTEEALHLANLAKQAATSCGAADPIDVLSRALELLQEEQQVGPASHIQRTPPKPNIPPHAYGTPRMD